MKAASARSLSWLAIFFALVVGCVTVTEPLPPTELPEVRPGYVAGNLQPNELPDSRALLPAFPAAGSAALAADEDEYRSTRALRDTPRWAQAALDAELLFPKATEHFSCALGIPISAEGTPHLNMLLRRVRTDASRATDKAKDYYRRPRPFMVARNASCTPGEEFRFKADSYPSGHASIGWAWALVLAQADPDHADDILRRGLAFGQSRVVCGVHWQSDVEAGRVIGAGTVSRLHASPVFVAQLAQARQEIAAARSAGAKPRLDCGAETYPLANDR